MDETIKEIRDADPLTVRETEEGQARQAPAEQDAGVTIKYGPPVGQTNGGFEFFRGWRILQQLPTKGAEADIFLVQAGEELCALKLYRHRLEPKLEILNRITEISRQNSHCFVVFLETGFDEQTGRWYELQEYIPLGSLRDVPMETKRDGAFIYKLVSELANAIGCLHENGIIHCDIKPANVLVRSLEPLDLVLTDFGISSPLASDMSQKMTSLKGTPMYWAPEAFSRVIGRPCDWWGLGMITLELLVGEHPLEGLNDSQIIHKLTLGNIEAPKALDPNWAILVKGLLTKDDALRWGRDNVVRWLSGERDIPVFYEENSAKAADNSRNAFRFEGKDYYTREDLARAFSASEKPWESDWDYLRYVRQWYERDMLFDDALELGKIIGKSDPKLALFRFIHGSAKCPFSVMGKLIDANNLHLFLARAISREASASESEIVEMMGDGTLSAFYEEYAAITGTRDQFMQNLLLFMKGKSTSDQWDYFNAMNNPGDMLWPRDTKLDTMEDRLETLKRIGSLPMKLDDFDRLKAEFILPRQLIDMIGVSETFSAGMAQLARWRDMEMLFPTASCADTSQRETYENLSLSEYEKKVRLLCLGHTPAVLEKLDFLRESFDAFNPPRDYPSAMMYFRAKESVNALKDKKVASKDLRFIDSEVDLFEQRRRIKSRRWMQYPVSGLAGGGLLFLVRKLPIIGSGVFMGILVFLTLFSAGLFYIVFGMGYRPENKNQADMLIGGVMAAVILFTLAISFSFFVGTLWGCAVVHVLNQYALLKNREAILETCASYASPLREDIVNE
jgi:serine/threonine protein kinase